MNSYDLVYKTPAKTLDDFISSFLEIRCWERYSWSLGNGYFGANVFGRLETERIQITELSLTNPHMRTNVFGGADVDNFAEILIDVNHSTAHNYERKLNLNTGVSTVKYIYKGVTFNRTYFISHIDDVMVCRFSANKSGNISLGIRMEVPFKRDYMVSKDDRGGKDGEVTNNKDDSLIISGEIHKLRRKLC